MESKIIQKLLALNIGKTKIGGVFNCSRYKIIDMERKYNDKVVIERTKSNFIFQKIINSIYQPLSLHLEEEYDFISDDELKRKVKLIAFSKIIETVGYILINASTKVKSINELIEIDIEDFIGKPVKRNNNKGKNLNFNKLNIINKLQKAYSEYKYLPAKIKILDLDIALSDDKEEIEYLTKCKSMYEEKINNKRLYELFGNIDKEVISLLNKKSKFNQDEIDIILTKFIS